jgi:FPC/CPF motif-containing protein YcgG
MTDTRYEERKKSDEDLLRELAVADVREWFESLPEERRAQRTFIMGMKTYSPRELMEEVENDTETGRMFTKMVHNVRMEMAKGNHHA